MVLRSSIDTPVARLGRYKEPPISGRVVYGGQGISRFLYTNNGDRRMVRTFLRLNRIGDPFSLRSGKEVLIPAKKAGFSTHPEA
jgi:hypothetical protein